MSVPVYVCIYKEIYCICCVSFYFLSITMNILINVPTRRVFEYFQMKDPESTPSNCGTFFFSSVCPRGHLVFYQSESHHINQSFFLCQDDSSVSNPYVWLQI